ncbi:hypothetical protein Aca07nite_77180 [Actinoplanes capillaceus]|uniref:Tetratricopeptide repeat-containing protein n=1 Tax=Actinoplanes campanulatus TaxID=113559 RepID=A0ABQ3WVW2_9ACTN|nr:hypothetical protein [Actinoplanes capillaceus]GID50443.1 hypothetical protein Aca07nite_77180 [Actinoplanes capillaceus]
MTDPQHLLAALDLRIRAFLDHDDGLPLFEPRVIADAEELLNAFATGGQPVPVEVVQTVAWLHWSRWRALPTDDHREDLYAARELFAILDQVDPELVPRRFRDTVDRESSYDAARILDGLTTGDDPALLDTAIAMLERGIDATLADDPHRGVHLLNLANGYRMRFERMGAPGQLDAAVEAARAALATGHFAGFGADAFRHTLEFVLDERHRLTQHPRDLDDLIEVMRDRFAPTGTDDPEWTLRAGRLTETILIRYGLSARDRDLDEAITVGRAALAGGADRLRWFGANLAASLVWRFEQSGDLAGLREAITVFQRTADALPDGDPVRVTCLSGLGGALITLFNADGDPGLLTEAITAGRAAVEAGPDDATAHANLALSLRTRFLATGEPADLDESIRLARVAADDAHAGDPNHGMFVSALSVSLQIRFEQFGRVVDLDDAVAAGRSAAAILPTGHPGRASSMINLANALRTRASLRGELADLRESVDVCRTVLAGLPARHRQQATALANLALALRDRYLALHDPTDIDEAVEASRAAVAALGATDPERPVYLMGLTRILRTRHKHEPGHDDVDEALQAARAAVTAGGDSPYQPISIEELSLTLLERYEDSSAAPDLDEALHYARLAIDASPPGNPNRAGYQFHLGYLLDLRGEHDSAVATWTDAAASSAGPLGNRIAAARAWGYSCARRERWPAAWRGYSAGIALIPLLSWRGIQRDSRERLLSDWAGLATDAAACAVLAGPPGEAAKVLESGRGVLWSQLLESRTAHTGALRERAPGLADRLHAVRESLDTAQVV